MLPRILELILVEQREVPRKVLDHLTASQRPDAPAPYGALAGRLPSSPSHFRILADKLCVTCMSKPRFRRPRRMAGEVKAERGWRAQW